MVTFKNNNIGRRNNFRRNDRNFKTNGDRSKFSSNFSNNETFQRRPQGRNNNLNAAKLIEKYSDLAREALSNEDKILSESYFQQADHFTRVLSEQNSLRQSKFTNNSSSSSDKLNLSNNKKEDEPKQNEEELKQKEEENTLSEKTQSEVN